MANILRDLSRRLPVLRSFGSSVPQTATDLTCSTEVLINAVSTDTADVSLPVIPEPVVGALPCSVDVPACSGQGSTAEVDNSRSSCNSRRHRRHHRRSRRHRLCRIKCKEVKLMSAMFSVIVIVLVCTSLYEPHWWYVGDTHCRDGQQSVVNYLSVRPFFYEGYFMTDGQQQNAYYFGSSQTDVLRNCVTPHTVYVIKAIVILCFVVIIFNAAAIILDIVLFASRCTKVLRNYAVFSILSVCTCVAINLLSYVVTQQLSKYYQSSSTIVPDEDKVDIEFSMCFYFIMASGVASVLAVASSLLCRCTGSSCGISGNTTAPRASRRRRDERPMDGDSNILYRSFLGDPSLPSSPPPYEP